MTEKRHRIVPMKVHPIAILVDGGNRCETCGRFISKTFSYKNGQTKTGWRHR